jgi:peptide/nickel transport system permease protein
VTTATRDHAADPLAAELAATAEPAEGLKGGRLWILRRLGLGLVVLFVVSVVVFAATQALPSDPARAILGREATPQLLGELRQQLGLDRPIVEQYGDWLGGVMTGDFGTSLASREPVTALMSDRVVNSLWLLTIVALIAVPLAIFLGTVGAIRRDGWLDRGTLLVSLALTALPEFVIGMLLVILLATTVFQVFPAVSLIPPGESPLGHIDQLVLPVLTLVLVVVPYLYRLVRASMIDVLESEYVAMARLKGMPEHIVTLRHALPNALVAMIQGSALTMVYLLGGIVVIDFLFQYPGLGSLLTDAVENRDMPVIQAVTLTFATGAVLFNLAADILTVYLTPKLRTGATRR